MEISWPGYAIANSNKKYQFIIGMYYGDNWDSSNDWSRKGITDIGDKYDNIVGGTEYAEKCNNICVYANGKLVGGTEPDGTVPQVQYTIAHLVRLRKAIVGISPFTSKETAQMFDINGDGNIDVFDETALRKIITK